MKRVLSPEGGVLPGEKDDWSEAHGHHAGRKRRGGVGDSWRAVPEGDARTRGPNDDTGNVQQEALLLARLVHGLGAVRWHVEQAVGETTCR